jgi:hypothetical protein
MFIEKEISFLDKDKVKKQIVGCVPGVKQAADKSYTVTIELSGDVPDKLEFKGNKVNFRIPLQL